MRSIILAVQLMAASTAFGQTVISKELQKKPEFQQMEVLVLASHVNDKCHFILNPLTLFEQTRRREIFLEMSVEQSRRVWYVNTILAQNGWDSAGPRYCRNLWDVMEAMFSSDTLEGWLMIKGDKP